MIKMNKLIGLAFTYVDEASSENEFITAGRIGRKMIVKELNCPTWVASRMLEMLGGKESWFPCADLMHKYGGLLPKNASDIFTKALKDLNIRFTTIQHGMGGITFKPLR